MVRVGEDGPLILLRVPMVAVYGSIFGWVRRIFPCISIWRLVLDRRYLYGMINGALIIP